MSHAFADNAGFPSAWNALATVRRALENVAA